MGLFNFNKGYLPANLRNGICPICDRPNIRDASIDSSCDSFDFICSNCNQGTIIILTGSIIGSDKFNNKQVKNDLFLDIQNHKKDRYPITVDRLKIISGEVYSDTFNTYSFTDWTNGRIPGDVSLHTSLSPEDKSLIRQEQLNIFNQLKKEKLEVLKDNLKLKLTNSIKPNILIQKEHSEVDSFLHGNDLDRQFDIIGFNDSLTNPNLHLIRSYYQKLIAGTENFGIIPNNTTREFNQVPKVKIDALVCAGALSDYSDYLKSLSNPELETKTVTHMKIENLNIYGGNQQFADTIINSSQHLDETDKDFIRLIHENTESEEERRQLISSLEDVKSPDSSNVTKEKSGSILKKFIESIATEGGKYTAKTLVEILPEYLQNLL